MYPHDSTISSFDWIMLICVTYYQVHYPVKPICFVELKERNEPIRARDPCWLVTVQFG
jgi:hypothetical protein